MQDNNQPALPSAQSAFSRPRRRRERPNIQPCPGLCRRLDFDDAVSNDLTSHSERNVTRALNEVAREEQAEFRERWRNNQAVNGQQSTLVHEVTQNMPASSWIPIPLSAEEAPTVLKRFQATELRLERRPESPIPFLNRSSLILASQREGSSSSSGSTPPLSLPSTNIHQASSSSFEPDTSLYLLPRSLSDIPVRSYSVLKGYDEDTYGGSSKKIDENIRGCLTPPRSPRSKDDGYLPTSSHKSQQVKLTDFYRLKKPRLSSKRSWSEVSCSGEKRRKRRKTWSV